jgi:uncharacterized protein (TIGR03085 family)
MVDVDLRERAELCDLFDELGPDAPTLCAGWTTADLAAHLVVRERDPIGAPGILLEGKAGPVGDKLASITASHMAKELERGFPAVVERVRTGPPPPFNWGPVRSRINLAEYVVHHEDVRRANGRGSRTGPEDLDRAVWGLLKMGARLFLRSARPVGVVLRTKDGQEIEALSGVKGVTITGTPVDLLLFCYGRGDASGVVIDGPPESVAALRNASFGI